MLEPGQIKLYSQRRRYGIIVPGHDVHARHFKEPNEQRDVFFKLCVVDERVRLRPGQKVWFERKTFPDGRSNAIRVTYSDGDA